MNFTFIVYISFFIMKSIVTNYPWNIHDILHIHDNNIDGVQETSLVNKIDDLGMCLHPRNLVRAI